MDKQEIKRIKAEEQDLKTQTTDVQELEIEFLGNLEEITFQRGFGSKSDPLLERKTLLNVSEGSTVVTLTKENDVEERG